MSGTLLGLGAIEAIVIGTSTGGIQALSVLLPAFAAESTIPVFVVVHLPRDRPNLLVEVFAKQCRLPVREAEDKEPVLPGTVYFAPTDYHLLVDAGPQLALSADELVHYSRPSIDVLFESAAYVYRSRLLGIILTGANDDGATGLGAILAAGGRAIVQDPKTAQAPQMSEAALRRSPGSLVLPLEGIADLLRSPQHRSLPHRSL